MEVHASASHEAYFSELTCSQTESPPGHAIYAATAAFKKILNDQCVETSLILLIYHSSYENGTNCYCHSHVHHKPIKISPLSICFRCKYVRILVLDLTGLYYELWRYHDKFGERQEFYEQKKNLTIQVNDLDIYLSMSRKYVPSDLAEPNPLELGIPMNWARIAQEIGISKYRKYKFIWEAEDRVVHAGTVENVMKGSECWMCDE